MKVNLSKVDTDQFNLKRGNIGDEEAFLVTPKHIGVKWTRRNLIFRSSVWTAEGELISAGLPKFANLGENPDVFGTPKSLKNASVVAKLDGTCLIVSKRKGNLIVRTRGTFDASFMENGFEIEKIKEKYPRVFCGGMDSWPYSLIFEWESPTNRIVIKHHEVDIKLIGQIFHENYTLSSQDSLDVLAQAIDVPRPKAFSFESLDSLIKEVKGFKNLEGVVIYSQDKIYKCKSDDYLAKHKLKSELCNFERVVDFYFQHGEPSYNDAYKAVVDLLDWETAEEIRGDLSRIVDAVKRVREIVAGMNRFINKISHFPDRKSKAIAITQAYGKTNRTSMVFTLLDGKPLSLEQKKKLVYQILKC